MGLLNLFKKSDGGSDSSLPYMVRTELVPYKLYSNSKSSTMLTVTLKNIAGEELLSSISVAVPKQLSLDETGISKQKEVKLGPIAPNQELNAKFTIYGDVGTEKGNYTINITAFVNHNNYAYVINSLTKKQIVQVV